jgi:hypothetical protein
MAFGWFKKKKQEEKWAYYDPSNVQLQDMVKGSFVDYDFKTWEVAAVNEYDWGDDSFTDEFEMTTAQGDTLFLNVEEDDGWLYSVFKKVNIRALQDGIVDYIKSNEMPPEKLIYEGVTYYRTEENVGYFRNREQESWREIVSWLYFDEDEDKVLSIDQWGEEDFGAAVGFYAETYSFSNIIMP